MTPLSMYNTVAEIFLNWEKIFSPIFFHERHNINPSDTGLALQLESRNQPLTVPCRDSKLDKHFRICVTILLMTTLFFMGVWFLCKYPCIVLEAFVCPVPVSHHHLNKHFFILISIHCAESEWASGFKLFTNWARSSRLAASKKAPHNC